MTEILNLLTNSSETDIDRFMARFSSDLKNDLANFILDATYRSG
ncbi:MAG: hypothetical protein OXC97_05620 [Candidatus Dadabacteria bacterium]|nr:hypothetical protein [Candidatus Dadabacteria bacterium]